MKAVKILFAVFFALCLTSCYKDFIDDYEYSTAGFAITNPLRTTIADRDMEIFVGISIGGKRAVDMNDWATFEILSDTIPAGYHLLPDNYYTLSDPNTMRVRKSNLPVADVGIKFTDDFYNDNNAIGKYYVLPFLITGSSLDSITTPLTVIAIKFISTFQGTYYIKGTLEELDAQDGNVVNTTVYNDKDLIKNATCDLQTIGKRTLIRPGVANFAATNTEKVQLTFEVNDSKDEIYNVLVQPADGGIDITDGSGTYYGNKEQPEIQLKYSFVRGGKYYRVDETLVLRQDPLYDLRVETW